MFSHQKNEMIYVHRFKVEGAHVNQEVVMNVVNDIQKRYHYNNITFKGNFIFMAVKAQQGMSDAVREEMEEEYSETMKIINLKHPGITVSEQDYLYRYEGEKIEMFIKRISKDNY